MGKEKKKKKAQKGRLAREDRGRRSTNKWPTRT